MINDLTPTQRDLAELMSDISENAWRAGWMQGLEYELWSAVKLPAGSGTRRLATQTQLEQLSKLSKDCGGWIVFDQEREETFVALAEWEALYGKWRSA